MSGTPEAMWPRGYKGAREASGEGPVSSRVSSTIDLFQIHQGSETSQPTRLSLLFIDSTPSILDSASFLCSSRSGFTWNTPHKR